MAKHSIRDLLRKKRTEQEEMALSPGMRDLMVRFKAQYEHRHTQDGGRLSQQEPDRR